MAASLHRFANPARFMRLSAAVLPWAVGAVAVTLPAGLWLALVASPPDYQQGESVRIMYVHVPAAWMALFVYVAMAGLSAAALIWRHPLADIAARAALASRRRLHRHRAGDGRPVGGGRCGTRGGCGTRGSLRC